MVKSEKHPRNIYLIFGMLKRLDLLPKHKVENSKPQTRNWGPFQGPLVFRVWSTGSGFGFGCPYFVRSCSF